MAVQDEVPKSRITLRYKTEVNGEPAPVDLPLRLLVLGDLSGGTSKDRQVSLEERQLHRFDGSNTNDVMKDMGISLNMVVPNKVDPHEESMRVQLNIESLNSFSPEEVAKQVPQIRSIMLLKKLLEEIQSNIANQKEFAQLLNKLFSNQELLAKMREKLKNYSIYRIPEVEHVEEVEEEEKKS
jgi:type VI secretion system protein ImpB